MEVDKEEIEKLYSLIDRLHTQIIRFRCEIENYDDALNYVPQDKVPYMLYAKIHHLNKRRLYLKELDKETKEVLEELKTKYNLD